MNAYGSYSGPRQHCNETRQSSDFNASKIFTVGYLAVSFSSIIYSLRGTPPRAAPNLLAFGSLLPGTNP